MIPTEGIARICHEANRAYQAAVPAEGIPVAPTWDDFSEQERARVIEGVELALVGATPEQLHDAWCEAKYDDGWAWGPVKVPSQKLHPCLLPYDELPQEQRVKDALFGAIVKTLGGVA